MVANRRQLWWMVNLVCYFVFLAAIVGGILPISSGVGKMAAVLWTGLIAIHSIMMYTMQDSVKEKNKRQFSLSDDGELVEVSDTGDHRGEEAFSAAQADSRVDKQNRS